MMEGSCLTVYSAEIGNGIYATYRPQTYYLVNLSAIENDRNALAGGGYFIELADHVSNDTLYARIIVWVLENIGAFNQKSTHVLDPGVIKKFECDRRISVFASSQLHPTKSSFCVLIT